MLLDEFSRTRIRIVVTVLKLIAVTAELFSWSVLFSCVSLILFFFSILGSKLMLHHNLVDLSFPVLTHFETTDVSSHH